MLPSVKNMATALGENKQLMADLTTLARTMADQLERYARLGGIIAGVAGGKSIEEAQLRASGFKGAAPKEISEKTMPEKVLAEILDIMKSSFFLSE